MITVRPANQARWADLTAIFGVRGNGARCWCQRYKLPPGEGFASAPPEVRADRLREQTHCDDPASAISSGLVAYLDDQPVGWCAVEPRPMFAGLLRSFRVPWEGRDENKHDAGVWALTCLFVRAGSRRRGVSRALAHAAVDLARERGARALEAYPILTGNAIAEELHVGSLDVYLAAGLVEVSRPTIRRAVVRIDF